jgi:FtsH-binding integral membrane protein
MNEILGYARRGRNDWWRYLATPMLAVVLVLLVDLITDRWIAQSGLLPKDFKALADDPSHPTWFFGYGSLFSAGLLLSLVVSALIVHHKRFTDIIGKWRWGHVASGAGAGLILFIVATGIDYLVQPAGFRLIKEPQTATLLLVAVPYALLLIIFVQFLFCGYLTQGILLATKRPLVTALVVGVISTVGSKDWPHAAGDFATMAVWVLITIRTGGIAFACGMGLVGELFGAVVVVDSDSSLRGSPGLIAQTTPGLAWFDAAVSCVLLVALWLWVVRRYPVTEQAADVFA